MNRTWTNAPALGCNGAPPFQTPIKSEKYTNTAYYFFFYLSTSSTILPYIFTHFPPFFYRCFRSLKNLQESASAFIIAKIKNTLQFLLHLKLHHLHHHLIYVSIFRIISRHRRFRLFLKAFRRCCLHRPYPPKNP